MISQKCQYALRAILELASRTEEGPVRIAMVAKAQGIPVRFLENILNELKQGGFVDSRRGKSGGYFLVSDPAKLSVGDIIRFIEGPLLTIECDSERGEIHCPHTRNCAFQPMWESARTALSEVYDSNTFDELARVYKAGQAPAHTYQI